MKLFCCDLDGTLLPHGKMVSNSNIKMLRYLRSKGVVVTLATGRSLHSLHSVFSLDMPIDYAIIATGSGILRWDDQVLIRREVLSEKQARYAIRRLAAAHMDFTIQKPLPDNHCLAYYSIEEKDTDAQKDYKKRLCRLRDFAQPLDIENWHGDAGQLLCVMESDEQQFNYWKTELSDFSVIRATSPNDNKSIWMEIFPSGVNKAAACDWLAKHTGCSETYAIGNDHNDLDMLLWADHSLMIPGLMSEEIDKKIDRLETPIENVLQAACSAWKL